MPKRTLLKVFGIRIDIIVQSLVSPNLSILLSLGDLLLWKQSKGSLSRSQARKFDIIPTLTAIGSGVGIFGVVRRSPRLIVYTALCVQTDCCFYIFPGNCSLWLGAALFATKERILQEHEIQIHRHTFTGKIYIWMCARSVVVWDEWEHRMAAERHVDSDSPHRQNQRQLVCVWCIQQN